MKHFVSDADLYRGLGEGPPALPVLNQHGVIDQFEGRPVVACLTLDQHRDGSFSRFEGEASRFELFQRRKHIGHDVGVIGLKTKLFRLAQQIAAS